MKRIALGLGMLLMTAPMARADLTHRMTSSTQLTVNGAYTDNFTCSDKRMLDGLEVMTCIAESGEGEKMEFARETCLG